MTKLIIIILVLALHYGAYLYLNNQEISVSKSNQQTVPTTTNKIKKKPSQKKSVSLSDLSMEHKAIKDESFRIKKRKEHKYSYCLPYKAGNTFTVTQTTDGPTHKGKAKYAIDFNLNEGAEVAASRRGKVIEVVGHFSSRGRTEEFYDKANRVMVQHADGSIALYGHLKPNGTNVEVGDYVKEGQTIGYSGETGFVSGAHLHFAVGYFRKGLLESIPIMFELDDGVASNLQTRKKYKAFVGCRSKVIN